MPTSRVLGFQGLSNLPSEIVCLVLANTSVPDILHVRATCRRLQRVSRERIVWIEALRNLCAEMELLVPSFPMERMSPEQLEYAASCHVRFRGLSKAFFSHPGHEQIPLSGIVRTINWPTPFRALHIIPGGRYLITMTETTLQLWDLGFGFHIPDFASLQPVASMECNVLEDSTIWIGSFPGLNGSVTIELTDEMPADNGGVSLTLFHVSNLESNPKFVEVGHFETPHATYFATSPNGLPTVFFEANTNFMGIWDVKANMGARWKSDEPAALVGHSSSFSFVDCLVQVNTTGGNVLQINRDRLAMDIFDFPRQLFPIEANSLPETIIHDPLFSIEWGKELLRHGEVTAIRLANEWILVFYMPPSAFRTDMQTLATERSVLRER
ncbi:hypothetical protein DL96DRAFT_703476 [Flagelloscypha sp. PMI_526]|nr:hypothetical protein DL96DRAFT_703476 [Flagelloscypha sp. PMI_526]